MAVQHSAGLACHLCKPSDQLQLLLKSRPGTYRAFRSRNAPFAQAGKSASISSVQAAKSKLSQLAGKKYGHNLSESQKQAVREVLTQLEASGSIGTRSQELQGSNWELLYTESTGSSGGKVGPFVGQVDQVFPANRPGIYINKLQLGPIRADLSANYKFSASDQIDVSFIDISAYLGPFRIVQKDFSGRSGYWKLTYSDDDLRILYTNQDNVFVLKHAS